MYVKFFIFSIQFVINGTADTRGKGNLKGHFKWRKLVTFVMVQGSLFVRSYAQCDKKRW
jgi:hypothetical protein